MFSIIFVIHPIHKELTIPIIIYRVVYCISYWAVAKRLRHRTLTAKFRQFESDQPSFCHCEEFTSSQCIFYIASSPAEICISHFMTNLGLIFPMIFDGQFLHHTLTKLCTQFFPYYSHNLLWAIYGAKLVQYLCHIFPIHFSLTFRPPPKKGPPQERVHQYM